MSYGRILGLVLRFASKSWSILVDGEKAGLMPGMMRLAQRGLSRKVSHAHVVRVVIRGCFPCLASLGWHDSGAPLVRWGLLP